MSVQDEIKILRKFFPEPAVNFVLEDLHQHQIQLRFSRSRSSKLGDFRPAIAGKPFRISLNHDLNPYEMLITWVHEIAHLHAFKKYGRRHQPHGNEWKQLFGELMKPYLALGIFPDDIKEELYQYLYKSGAANGSDLHLRRLLKNYNSDTTAMVHTVESLPLNALFTLPDGRVFQKLEQRRKRFKCLCMNDKRYYLFSPIAVVTPIDGQNSNQSVYLTKKII